MVLMTATAPLTDDSALVFATYPGGSPEFEL